MSIPCSVPDLPLELLDPIFEFLRSNHRALSNCALTCHAWYPVARRHIFHSLSIRTPRAQKLENFLRNNSLAGRCVRELSIRTISDNLEAPLTLFGPNNMPELRKLSLRQTIGTSVRPLLRTLRLLPSLRELSLDLRNPGVGTEIGPEPHDDQPTEPASAQLKSLTLSLWGLKGPYHPHLLNELFASGMLAQLESLTLSSLRPNNPPFTPLISETAETLTEVRIYGAKGAAFGPIVDALALCSALRRLTLEVEHLPMHPADTPHPAQAFHLFSALATRVAPALHSLLHLHVVFADTALRFVDDYGTAWQDVAHALRGHARVKVSFHTFELTEVDEWDAAGPQLRALLREFEEYGVRTNISL